MVMELVVYYNGYGGKFQGSGMFLSLGHCCCATEQDA